MLTEEELTAIREHNKCLTDNTGLVIARGEAATIDFLLTEIRELRLLLRDAVQDATPGNRVWREGVKAGLAAVIRRIEEGCEKHGTSQFEFMADIHCHAVISLVQAIDPATILPPR